MLGIIAAILAYFSLGVVTSGVANAVLSVKYKRDEGYKRKVGTDDYVIIAVVWWVVIVGALLYGGALAIAYASRKVAQQTQTAIETFDPHVEDAPGGRLVDAGEECPLCKSRRMALAVRR